MTKTNCSKCGTEVDPAFPLHMCRPTPNFLDAASGSPEVRENAQVLQETGHASMLDRVKATHRMLTGMQDEWDRFVEVGNEARPKYVRGVGDVKFLTGVYDTFDSVNLEDIRVSKSQFFYVSDIYSRSL